MNRLRTSRLVTIASSLILLLPSYGCNRDVSPPQTENKPTVESTEKYSAKTIEELLDEGKIVYNRKKVEESWSMLNPEERKLVCLAYENPKSFYESMSPERQARYDEVSNSGLIERTRTRTIQALGFEDENKIYKSSWSLIAFELIDSLPAMR